MLGVALLLLWGCAAGGRQVAKPGLMEQYAPRPKVQASPLKEYLLPQMEKKQSMKGVREERFSIAVQDTKLKDVLMILARDSRYNMIVDPAIDDTVTIDLKKVTMGDALQSILSPLQLEYKIRGNTIEVIRPRMATRVFTLNYITATRTGETGLTVSSGGRGGENASAGDYGTVKSTNKVALWEDLRQGLNTILFGSGEGGGGKGGERLVINEHSGTILVTALPEKLMEIAGFLEAVEGSIQRQVMIQAKIVEVTLSDTFKAGIDWAGIPNLRGSFVGNLATGLAETQPQAASVVQNLSPDTGFFQIGATKGDISLLLDMIATQGKIHVLSSPRISTLNNQKAIIKAGREDTFFTLQKEINSEGGVLQENFTVEREDYTIGVVLDVTPQISRTGEIIMNIHPSITEFIEEKTFPPGAVGADILANAPVLDVREVDTMVRVKDGETIVIAGLMRERTDQTITSVPFLGDLPVLGKLFQRVEKKKENTELVILLQPTVTVGGSPGVVSSAYETTPHLSMRQP